MNPLRSTRPASWVTVKCDVCSETMRYDHEEEILSQFDAISGMVVCECCQEDFEKECRKYDTPFQWEGVPDRRIDFEVYEHNQD